MKAKEKHTHDTLCGNIKIQCTCIIIAPWPLVVVILHGLVVILQIEWLTTSNPGICLYILKPCPYKSTIALSMITQQKKDANCPSVVRRHCSKIGTVATNKIWNSAVMHIENKNTKSATQIGILKLWWLTFYLLNILAIRLWVQMGKLMYASFT